MTDIKMEEIQIWDLKKIKPYKHNNKNHSQAQVDLLAENMKMFGITQPIVVNPKGVLIIGEGRYLAFKKLGLEKVPVVVKDFPENKESALRIADNKISQYAVSWNMPAMSVELNKIKTDPDLFKLTTFKMDDIKYLSGFTDKKSVVDFGNRDKMPEAPSDPIDAMDTLPNISALQSEENEMHTLPDQKNEPKAQKHYLYIEIFGLWDREGLKNEVNKRLEGLGASVR